MYRALIDERGPWSSHPFPNAIITHWKLDKTEDSWRRRPKLKRNYKYDERLCHPPTAKISNGASQPANESFTGTGTSFPEQMKQFLLKGVRGITEEKSLETCDDDLARLNDSGPNNSSENQIIEYIKDHSSEVDIVPDKKEPSSGSVESDLSEVLFFSFTCKLSLRVYAPRNLCIFFFYRFICQSPLCLLHQRENWQGI